MSVDIAPGISEWPKHIQYWKGCHCYVLFKYINESNNDINNECYRLTQKCM